MHFCKKYLEGFLAKYSVKKKVSIPYHPKTYGQVEVSIRKLKQILEKRVTTSRKDWSKMLFDILWVYRTTFKNHLGLSPYQVVDGKVCHLPFELEYKTYRVIKLLNFDEKPTRRKWLLKLDELEMRFKNIYLNVLFNL